LSDAGRELPAGRVGRAHGLDGSFYVERPSHELPEGTALTVAGRGAIVERRAGTDERPLVRLSGVADREAAEALRGEALLVADRSDHDAVLAAGEWLAADLVGCRIEGIGEVHRVVEGPSCDVLEVGDDGVLVPFVSDAIKRVDTEARVIEVDRGFLDLGE
jgi:16S rRNA processing protein RimM